ncbi:MerR family transcriptional regulator [Desulfobulbus sp.]|uniref:MerR family transcriptional regulator n=1 Tax=Desulfobulbus sp. TaxID=895 RepID=UPI00286F6528|nr:MerR family transcriptional regulator [Desulfobulbus sp.]
MNAKTFSLDELCLLTDCSKRTVRYYIQLGLVSRPVGEARAARYTGEHLSQLLRIKKLSESGVSLERIREVLAGEDSPVPPRERHPGTVEVRSHIYVAPGIEVQITPEEAGISPEQLRKFVGEVMALAKSILGERDKDSRG